MSETATWDDSRYRDGYLDLINSVSGDQGRSALVFAEEGAPVVERSGVDDEPCCEGKPTAKRTKRSSPPPRKDGPSACAVAVVDGNTGSCDEVLSTDPVTGTTLTFLGVAPQVYETPSRTRMLAMVRGATDAIPYYVRIDLDEESYLDPTPFSPADAQDITVLGTGADPVTREGIFVVSYLAGGRQVIAQFVDEDGNVSDPKNVDGVTD